ncbi:MAG TPA: GGDEF domain-containing protein [Ideonella sp.]|uniref:GGDEF domain-containing protein n=1 Tax=Ideonella sp. TaxID=1929293 RepID=UPI002BC3674F|nr:GGDEF domain-containing protein [Ideonella sp.]HSI46707.1 GGDEF domain-containing protein [Ideonella sp.]
MPVFSHLSPGAAALAALLRAGLLVLALPWACGVQARPAVWQQQDALVLDDPHAAERWTQHELAAARIAGNADGQFWLLLGAASVQDQLEDTPAQLVLLHQAEGLLKAWPGAGELHKAWLAQAMILADLREKPAAEIAARIAALRRQIEPLKASDLQCELASLDLWAMVYAGNNDEAWVAGEALERCAHAVGSLDQEVSALLQLGTLTSQVSGKVPAAGQGEDYFRRALALLGDRPARFMRSLLEWQLGNALVYSRQLPQARAHFENALVLSRDLQDEAGVAAALIKVGERVLEDGNAEASLSMAREAQALMEAQHNEGRLLSAHVLVVRSLTALRRADVLHAIEQARPLDAPARIPFRRIELATAMAEGFASQGLYAKAYAELSRANLLRNEAKEILRDSQMLRLQARYEGARRDAENADLRRRSETAHLELVAQAATRQSLWAALTALLLLLALAAVVVVRGWRKRRNLAELAMRDELTGLPNRRAIKAAGEAQLAQARQWQLPFSVALIDLDHFKQVNDRLGHAAGDAVLQALAAAAGRVLRGQDRLGRLGGEEFLLLMPGTTLGELNSVFDRLRAAFTACEIAGLPTPHGVRFSMGGAEWQPGADSLAALIDAADQALYVSKAAGRDQLSLAEPATVPLRMAVPA